MMDALPANLPRLHFVFDQKCRRACVPSSLLPNLTLGNFFFPDEKSPQREMFANVDDMKQKHQNC